MFRISVSDSPLDLGRQVGDAVSGLRHVYSTSVENSIASVSSVASSLKLKEMTGNDIRIQHRSPAYETSAMAVKKTHLEEKIEGWTALGDVRGAVVLIPWPCRHFLKPTDAPNIAQSTFPATSFHDNPFESSDISLPPHQTHTETESMSPIASGSLKQTRQILVRGQGRLSGRVQCLQVGAGNVFVVASCHGAIFQWRLVAASSMAVDPHVRMLAALSSRNTSPETTSTLSNKDSRPRVAAQAVPTGKIAELPGSSRKDKYCSVTGGLGLEKSRVGSGIHVGPPGWMKEVTAEGLDADRRLTLPDQGLQLEHAFGCDGRGVGCGAMVITDSTQVEGTWLGDMVWFSGSVAVVHNAISGPAVNIRRRCSVHSCLIFFFKIPRTAHPILSTGLDAINYDC